MATAYIVEGKIPEHYNEVPKLLLKKEVLKSFGVELVELLTTSSSRLDSERSSFAQKEIVSILQRMEHFFKWAINYSS